jgi:hypothetical protein
MNVLAIAIVLVTCIFVAYGLNWFVVGAIIGGFQGIWMNVRYPHRWPLHSMGMMIIFSGLVINGTALWLLVKLYTAVVG